MKRRVQLSGIIDSYRVVGKKRPSLIIPFLISFIFIGMIVFFFTATDKPGGKNDTAQAKSEQSQPREDLPLLDPEPVTEPSAVSQEPKKTSPEIPRAVLVEETLVKGKFTDWMPISDLDATIKLMNLGHKKTFWERGHWITAAEGRWQQGAHQFRIVWEKTPKKEKYLWHYKLNQSQDDFTRSIDTFLSQGYKLVHSQSFSRPDRTMRFQGIWQKQQNQSAAASEAIPIGNEPTARPASQTKPRIISQQALSQSSNLRQDRPREKPKFFHYKPPPTQNPQNEKKTTTASSSSLNRKNLNLSDILSYRGQP